MATMLEPRRVHYKLKTPYLYSRVHVCKLGIMMNGAEHAREWITTAVMTYIAQRLVTKYGEDETLTKLVDTYEWTIVPVLNIDGCK